jgi:hypothetical protein
MNWVRQHAHCPNGGNAAGRYRGHGAGEGESILTVNVAHDTTAADQKG